MAASACGGTAGIRIRSSSSIGFGPPLAGVHRPRSAEGACFSNRLVPIPQNHGHKLAIVYDTVAVSVHLLDETLDKVWGKAEQLALRNERIGGDGAAESLLAAHRPKTFDHLWVLFTRCPPEHAGRDGVAVEAGVDAGEECIEVI